MVALCFDLTQNIVIMRMNVNVTILICTHYIQLSERKKKRKYHLTSMDYIVNMEVNYAVTGYSLSFS